jgi:hypothetical protein
VGKLGQFGLAARSLAYAEDTVPALGGNGVPDD